MYAVLRGRHTVALRVHTVPRRPTPRDETSWWRQLWLIEERCRRGFVALAGSRKTYGRRRKGAKDEEERAERVGTAAHRECYCECALASLVCWTRLLSCDLFGCGQCRAVCRVVPPLVVGVCREHVDLDACLCACVVFVVGRCVLLLAPCVLAVALAELRWLGGGASGAYIYVRGTGSTDAQRPGARLGGRQSVSV